MHQRKVLRLVTGPAGLRMARPGPVADRYLPSKAAPRSPEDRPLSPDLSAVLAKGFLKSPRPASKSPRIPHKKRLQRPVSVQQPFAAPVCAGLKQVQHGNSAKSEISGLHLHSCDTACLRGWQHCKEYNRLVYNTQPAMNSRQVDA